MPAVDVLVESPVADSFRVRQIAGRFGLDVDVPSRERFRVEVPGEDEPWTIGAIVGPSGSGKTTVARQAFGDCLYAPREWSPDAAIIDGFGDLDADLIMETLSAVGLASVPSWVRPYDALSNGEKFRCELARALLASTGPVAFDEFTSVVDRTVAKVGAACVAKWVRRQQAPGRRFVAITCHYDVLDWLAPDWVLDMADGSLTRRRLRRPALSLAIHRAPRSLWRAFARHHYLSHANLLSVRSFVGLIEGVPVALVVALSAMQKGALRLARVVVRPDFQGMGIGRAMADVSGQLLLDEGYQRVSLTAAHPAMIRALQASPRWRLKYFYPQGHGPRRCPRESACATSNGRPVATFEFVGDRPPPDPAGPGGRETAPAAKA